MNSLQHSTAQNLLIITNLVIHIKVNVNKFTIKVPESTWKSQRYTSHHSIEPADDFTEEHPKKQAYARSEPYQRQETDQRKTDRGV